MATQACDGSKVLSGGDTVGLGENIVPHHEKFAVGMDNNGVSVSLWEKG